MTFNSSRTSLNMYHQRTRLYSFEKQVVNRLYIKEIIMDPECSFGDPECEKPLNTLELQAWHAFKWICSNFLISQLHIKKALQRCLRHTKRWGVACL